MEKNSSGRYEFIEGSSRKFWEAICEGNTVTIRYGRIGTTGNVLKKVLSTETEAYNYLHEKIEEKCRKGYKPAGTVAYPQSDSASAVICHAYVGEHVVEVAKGLCRWLTKCLKNKMSVKEFEKIWTEFVEDGESKKVPGVTVVSGEKEYWIDNLEFEDDLVFDGIYKKAVEDDADRFITFNNNAYIDIVAIRGKPTPREIALFVLGSEENVGDWTEDDTRDALGKY